jgi:hypothetical protein
VPESVDLSTLASDRGDQHVCALAVAGKAQYLLTFDRGYLSEPFRELGVAVLEPDTFLSTAIDQEPDAFAERAILEAQTATWARRTTGDGTDRRDRARAGPALRW